MAVAGIRSSPTRRRVAAVVLVVLALLLSVLPAARWRISLVWKKVTGQLVIMDWGDVLLAATPFNPARINLPALIADGNPVTAGWITAADSAAGRELFATHCARCHGVNAEGGTGPDLTTTRLMYDTRLLYRTIRYGRRGTAMAGVDLPEGDIWLMAAYLASVFKGAAAPSANAPRVPPPGITASRLVEAGREPHNWLTYSRTYDGQRHSPLAQITAQNVGGLSLEWIHQLEYAEGRVETTPLVIDGVMYLTEPPANVEALDARTGRRLWHYQRDLPDGIVTCCGGVNRGLAAFGDRLYLATLDANLVALDATTGAVAWDVDVADHRAGYSMTLAPLAVGNRIIVGVSGSPFNIRGFIDAYDAATGARLWRFWTVPGPGDAGRESWAGESASRGGAPAWLTGSYDPALNLLYWGVGNPWPAHESRGREGDNLYSSSVVALRPETGQIVWHYQFTPHDLWDRDSTQIPVLVDGTYEGRFRRLMLWANRNGFYYVLDRETGEFLTARAFAEQTWATGFDRTGRPIRHPGAEPSPGGSLVSPGPMGATNWWSPTFHPRLNRFYVATIPSSSATYYSGLVDNESRGVFGVGASGGAGAGPPAIRALDAYTGERVWEYAFPDRVPDGSGGLLSTAGDVIFGGAWETFVALDARTGAELWRFGTGGVVAAAPITYMVDGRQRITVAAGRSILTFALRP